MGHAGKNHRKRSDMKVNLQNKLAVITGGSGYLCSEMGCALAKHGAHVVIIARDQEKLDNAVSKISKFGTQIHSISADVTQLAHIKNAYDTITKNWGVCDILINGAGGNNASVITTDEIYTAEHLHDKNETTFFDLQIEDIEHNFSLNFLSALMCTQIFAKDMITQGGGNIINISSMATYNTITRVVSYSAAKAALDNLTRWLAVYFSNVGIRVNAIAPGFFLGEQNRHLLVDEHNEYTHRGKKIIRNTPMNRFGTADELTSTLLYLVSEESAFITGQIIAVDGGFSIYSGV